MPFLRPSPRLLQANDPRNLVAISALPHTRFTYHRTWETGLEAEIRVAVFSPDFFGPQSLLPTHPDYSPPPFVAQSRIL